MWVTPNAVRREQMYKTFLWSYPYFNIYKVREALRFNYSVHAAFR